MKGLRVALVTAGVAVGGFVILGEILPETDRAAGPRGAAVAVDDESAAWSSRYVAVRDEAIANVGWIAGNAEGQASWGTIGPLVTPGGTWYAWVDLVAPGEDPDVAAIGNVQRYRDWRARGRAAGFDRVEAESRAARLLQLTDELTGLLEERRGQAARG